MRLYGEFTKVEEKPDGTILVSGIASSESVDTAGETVLASAMRSALPDYLKFPAVREQHDPTKAAGTALSVEVADDGMTYLEALIVDPIAIAKVKAKVYRGFSIGGNVPPGGRDPANPKTIRALNLTEVSLVDRPANPDAVLQLVKLDAAPAAAPAVAKDDPVDDAATEEPQGEAGHRKNAESASEPAQHGWAASHHEDEAWSAQAAGQPAIADAHRAAASAHREAQYAKNEAASKRACDASRVAHAKTDAFRAKAATAGDGTARPKTDPAATVPSEVEPTTPLCVKCGKHLTCPKCNAPAESKAAAAASALLDVLAKGATVAADALAKAHAERDAAIAKVAEVEERLAKATALAAQHLAERDAVQARLAAAPPKGALRAVPISKADDVRGGLPEPEEDEDEPLAGQAAVVAEIKKAHLRPVVAKRGGERGE